MEKPALKYLLDSAVWINGVTLPNTGLDFLPLSGAFHFKYEEAPSPRTKETKRVEWPDIEVRARRIFGGRLLPNLVLFEREENSF
jgi:hypothetical protein